MDFYKANGEVIHVSDDGSTPASGVTGIQQIARKIFKGQIKQILLLGDSITAGAGGSDYAGPNGYQNPTGYCWANLFKKYMADTYGITTRNYARYGSIVSEQWAIYQECKQAADDLVIWLSGTNNRTEARYSGYVSQIPGYIETLAAEKDLIMISCIPASQSSEESSDHTTREIDEVLFSACIDKSVNFFSGYQAISKYCDVHDVSLSSLLADTAHPNNAGHLAMFKIFCNEIGIPLPPYIDFSYGNYPIS